MSLKVAVIGSGSSYTPELINGFLDRVDTFPLTNLWLMDISQERQEIVGKFAQRMVQAKGAPFAVHLTTDQREAVAGASYVITQLRVGGMEARRKDEYMGRRHGLIGQETTGIGGMAKAMRTIPVILNLAEDMVELAPGALLVNFANPAGLVTEALSRYAPNVPSVGVCNVPMIKMDMLEELEKRYGIKGDPRQTQLNTLGLNHLSWHRGLMIDGQEYWPQVLEIYLDRLKAEENPPVEPRIVEVLGMLPNYYLQYYYHTDRKLAAQQKWPPSRAEEVMKVEAGLLAQYAEPDRTEPPAELMQRGGKYYSTIATQLLAAHYNDLGETHVVNVRHNGTVPGWPEDWVLEMPCRVSRSRIQPLPAEPLPPVCFGLLAQVKMFEILTVEAAIRGDREAAYQALLAHPLGPTGDKVQLVLDDMLATHRAHLPQFWGA
ncbi:MAG: 6-phospho-beta-glucosidase [Anaerolineae bacterium]|nr:6-phospho-beta-glucosidase [Anaerolineae bacterium]